MNRSVEHDMTEIKEKREFVRKKIEIPMRYSIDMGGEYLGFVHDISYGGMFFESKEKHKVSDNIQADLNVELYGKIVWMHGYVIRASDKGVAVKFTHYDRNGFDEIMQLDKKTPETDDQALFQTVKEEAWRVVRLK